MRVMKACLKRGKNYRLMWYAAGYSVWSEEGIAIEQRYSTSYMTGYSWECIHWIPSKGFPINSLTWEEQYNV